MVRTQIQLPDDVYRHAKRLAEAREISLAELVRRGLELIVSQYPAPEDIHSSWRLPTPRRLGWRGLTDAEIKDLAQITETEDSLMPKGR